MNLFLQVFAMVVVTLSAILSILLFIHLRWPAPVLWFLKLYVSALSPLLAFMGLLLVLLSFATGSVFPGIVAAYVTLVFFIHLLRVTRPPAFSSGFDQAFGLQWKHLIHAGQKNQFLSSRRVLTLPRVPVPRLEQDVSYASIPGNGRQVLCDVWQPPNRVIPSGLAFIYLHGGAFYYLDKDFGTRPFFRHLAAQGHVIMDVAYRQPPETDMMGMVHDVRRAIAWMKEHAHSYAVNPKKIVLGGGSAGGHLALLAAYTEHEPAFRPIELESVDLSISAVISLYGTSDLTAHYYHTNQHLTSRSIPGKAKKKMPARMPQWVIRKMGKDYHRLGMDKNLETTGALAPLMGGHPDECPGAYALYSPGTHIHAACPPTLLVHGEHDIMAPVEATRSHYSRLQEKNVQAVMHLLPQTDHGFDLVLPNISPSAHNAIYDVERFLALHVNTVSHKPPVSGVIQQSNYHPAT